VLRRRTRNRHDHPAGLNRFRHRSRGLALCAALATAALAVPGCGGNDDGGSATVSKQDFIKQAEAICTKAQTALALQLTKEFGRAKISKSELVDFTKTAAIPNIEHQLEQIRALPQPDEGGATLERYYAEFERGIEQLKQDPSLVNRSAVPPAVTHANALARSFGIARCAR
jgi:hypothetical protein